MPPRRCPGLVTLVGALPFYMIEHIKQMAGQVTSILEKDGNSTGDPQDILKAIVSEIERLDSSEFAPDVRGDFAKLRVIMKKWATLGAWPIHKTAVIAGVKDLLRVLDKHGVQSRPGREFKWLKDPDLISIVERDYRELSMLLLPSGAWKSTVILAGSILEAILVDLLIKDPARLALARTCSKAPKYKGSAKMGTVKPDDEWVFAELIAIAGEIKLLPQARVDTFDQVLRDYRNFVHPRKEVRSAHPCGEAEALMAKGALDGVCDHFDRNPP